MILIFRFLTKADGQSPSGLAALGHLPCEGRLLRGRSPREKAPHAVGSWSSEAMT